MEKKYDVDLHNINITLMSSKLEIIGDAKEALDIVNAIILQCENTKKKLMDILETNPDSIQDTNKINFEHRSNEDLKLFYTKGCQILSSEIGKIKENSTSYSKDSLPEGFEKMINTIIWAEIIFNRRNVPLRIQEKTHISLEEIREKIKLQITIIEKKIQKINTIKETIIFLYGKTGYFQEDLNIIINGVFNGTMNDSVEKILEKYFKVEVMSIELSEPEPIFTPAPLIPHITPLPIKGETHPLGKKESKKNGLIIFWETLKEFFNTHTSVSWKQARKNVIKRREYP